MKIVPQHFEDYAIGDARTTLGRTITEADIVLHAGQTGDFFPHHMDAEWVKTQPFGQRIAHGTLILSVAVGMTAGDINPLAFSYGYDRIRFMPVPRRHDHRHGDDRREARRPEAPRTRVRRRGRRRIEPAR